MGEIRLVVLLSLRVRLRPRAAAHGLDGAQQDRLLVALAAAVLG